MDPDRRLTKALEAAKDALQHIFMSTNLGSLDCTHIDRLLARVVDLPTEGTQRNSRRNLLLMRQWMSSEGPSVVLLEVLGQLYWRLGELNSTQFEKFKAALHQQPLYTSLLQDKKFNALVVQRIRCIQKSKVDACQDFLSELSDLIGAQVDSPMMSLETLRVSSCSPARSTQSPDSNFSQETSFQSLIQQIADTTPSTENMEQFLRDFYVNGICPTRTVATQSNSYTSLVQVSEICSSTRYALLSLSASYLSDLVPKYRDFYTRAELYYSTQALEALAAQLRDGSHYDGALATSMLLMHHGMLHVDDSPICWSCHAHILDAAPTITTNPHSDPALFIRAQVILARTAQSIEDLQRTRHHAFETRNWLEGLPPTEPSRICGILGVSPQLLFSISSVTALASNPHRLNKLMHAQLLESQIQNIQQWISEREGPEKEILVSTAETFRVAALIYLRCRVYGFTRFHPSIIELSDRLYNLILSLPVKGPLYTAIYPVWPFFVAAVMVNEEKREKLCQRVGTAREHSRNTLAAVLRRIGGLRKWLAEQDETCARRDNWWDEMMRPGSSTITLGTNLLCLG